MLARPWIALVAVSLMLAAGVARAQEARLGPPSSPTDPRLAALRRASAAWDARRGPQRVVVDQVVLVPDVPSFFEAIAEWDHGHWFPILIEDAEYAPKFLRAFRPARVIRPAGRPAPIPPGELWDRATRAVGLAWSPAPCGPPRDARSTGATAPDASATPAARWRGRGDSVPGWLGPTPPGVVLSMPDSPSLAGAVALAAGRFQRLVLWKPDARREEVLDPEKAERLSLDLEAKIANAVPRYAAMGDDCDFLTLAGPYPVGHRIAGQPPRAGVAAVDDLLGRDGGTAFRWAYLGRLEADPVASVYRAMASLFLRPRSALLFDTYDGRNPDFRPYLMKPASRLAPKDLTVSLIDGAGANLRGWWRAMGLLNRFDLVYLNSSGSPTAFNLADSSGLTADIPPSVPCVVLMNHSFSAADPTDARTLAGAWLSGGAFLYFGSMNEPYIQGFRTPSLVLSLLREGLPIAAAVRMGPDEFPEFGAPWRLHLLGDPLYRIDARGAGADRAAWWEETSGWPELTAGPRPPAAAPEADRLDWAWRETLQDAASGREADAVEDTLLAIRRESLPQGRRAVWDGLMVDLLPRSRARRLEILARLDAVPTSERSPSVARTIAWARRVETQAALDRRE